MKRNAVKIGQIAPNLVIADYQGNITGEFLIFMPVQEISQAVIVLRNEQRNAEWHFRINSAPGHLEAGGNWGKARLEFSHAQIEFGQVPFDTHQKKIGFTILMLIGVDNIGIVAV